MHQLELAKREKAKLEEHVAFQARSFAEECIKIHHRSVQEAEQQASVALQHERKQHNTELNKIAAELALVRKQAQDCQQKLTDKEEQLSDVQCRLDESSALLEGLQSAQETARDPQQELTARDARIADLISKLEAAMSYRKKCVALGQECRQLRSLLQGYNDQPACADSGPSSTATPPVPDDLAQRLAAATERAEAAEARAEEVEARAAEAARVERENFKRYLKKKDRKYQQMQSELEDCKQHMQAHELQLPGRRMPQNEEEQKSDWDPDTCKEDRGSAPLPALRDSQQAPPESSEHRTISAEATAAAPSALPSTESETSQPDDANCCTVVYQPAGPAAEAEPDQRQQCSTADPRTDEKSAEQILGSSTPSPASSAPQEGSPEQSPAQTSKPSDGQHKVKRTNAACRPEISPKRQKTEGVLRDADLNTLVASQDSTEAMQTASACPRDTDNNAEAHLSATQLTMVTRQQHNYAAQEDRDSQKDSENIECTPQSSRAPARRSRPSPILPQPAEKMPQEPEQEQDAAAACAPGSPAWQVKSRERQAITAQAAGQHDVSLHLSHLQQPARREAAAALEPAGRPNPFRADRHSHAHGARPPPKWNQKQKGPALPDALAFLDLRQTQQAGARAPQHLPTIVERHAESLRPATEPAPQRRPPDNQLQFRPGEPGYKYKETVRKKAEREELLGIECVDCRKFYAAIETWGAVGDLPACGHAVRGAGAPPASAAAAPVREQLRQDASRHRYRYEPPATPDGFWDLGFMDSLDSRVQPQNYGGKEDGACS
ncbi:probable DNA endonuclease RBBP8 at C-terminar half [Coccomyxa sp. Obi]|nr:probable DNA endonuclease RBBP8 at C-terminar half [Coccomyxa sp. Obi]